MIPFSFMTALALGLNGPNLVCALVGGVLAGLLLEPLVPVSVPPMLFGVKVAAALLLFQVATALGAIIGRPELQWGFVGSHLAYAVLSLTFGLGISAGATLHRVRTRA